MIINYRFQFSLCIVMGVEDIILWRYYIYFYSTIITFYQESFVDMDLIPYKVKTSS